MKTNKLKLNDLKVNSFVTALDEKNVKTVQGGVSYTCPTHINTCPTQPGYTHCSHRPTEGGTGCPNDSIFPCPVDASASAPPACA